MPEYVGKASVGQVQDRQFPAGPVADDQLPFPFDRTTCQKKERQGQGGREGRPGTGSPLAGKGGARSRVLAVPRLCCGGAGAYRGYFLNSL